MSIGVLLPGRAEYYLGTVANGVEDYYTGAGEAPGQWCGTSAARLGLVGEVEADALHWVLEHADPVTGERLTTGHAVAKVIGFDTTFCPPKSVSLLFGLGDPEVSNEVRNAQTPRSPGPWRCMRRWRKAAAVPAGRGSWRVRGSWPPRSGIAPRGRWIPICIPMW